MDRSKKMRVVSNLLKTTRLYFRGSWRIRTAVPGFADQCLSHSAKEPFCFGMQIKEIFISLASFILHPNYFFYYSIDNEWIFSIKIIVQELHLQLSSDLPLVDSSLKPLL